MSLWPTIASPMCEPPMSRLSTPAGRPGVGQRLGEPNRQQRNGACGLPHDGVAVHQRGRDLPRRDRDREVERSDDADYADRLAGHQNLLAGAGRSEDLAGLSVALVAVVAQDLRGAAHLADPLGLRLAFLGGQLQPPGFGIALHHVRGGQQYRTALVDRCVRPTTTAASAAAATAASTSAAPAVPPSATTALGRAGLTLRSSSPLPESQWPATRCRIGTGVVTVVISGTPPAR